MSPSLYWGTYCFCPVCWFVCWFVGLFASNFNIGHNFCNIEDSNLHLACMSISWSCTFWVVKGQGHPTRSNVKYMGQNHNFCNIEDSNVIFGMHVFLMELHILSGERSKSSFKVKAQIYGSKSLKRGHSVSQTHLVYEVELTSENSVYCININYYYYFNLKHRHELFLTNMHVLSSFKNFTV